MIRRQQYIQRIQKSIASVPITVLIGARQVGKTTLMHSLDEDYYKQSLFLNGQNPEIAELFQKYSVIEQYLRQNLNESCEGYLFIDEFQYINNISTMLKLLVDEKTRLKIICSGSSSLNILQTVEESLAGRVRILPIYSLSFPEYIQFNDENLYAKYMKYPVDIDCKVIDKHIPILLNEYLLYGALPRVALAKAVQDKIELLNDIYQTYLLHDVRSFVRNEDFVGFNKMLRLIAAQIGNLVNINDLSKNAGLSYRKCQDYLHLLEQMYIISMVEPYAVNLKKTITKMKKVFFLDIGLRNKIYNSFNDIEVRTDNGALFENFCYLELCKHNPSSYVIYFYQTKGGSEIDFLVDNHKGIIPFEAKFSNYAIPRTIRSLSTFMEEEHISAGYVVNLNNNESIGSIRYIPGVLLSKVDV